MPCITPLKVGASMAWRGGKPRARRIDGRVYEPTALSVTT
jgi:hypothetical protein